MNNERPMNEGGMMNNQTETPEPNEKGRIHQGIVTEVKRETHVSAEGHALYRVKAKGIEMIIIEETPGQIPEVGQSIEWEENPKHPNDALHVSFDGVKYW
jgi:hypothetical protein